MSTQCQSPTIAAFDIDIYDCPCGHAYGAHDYAWVAGAMQINHCTECPPWAHVTGEHEHADLGGEAGGA